MRHKRIIKALPWLVIGSPVLVDETPHGDHDSDELDDSREQ